MKHIQKYLIPKGAILSKSLKKVSDHRSYVQPGSTTHLLVLSVFGMIYLYTLGYWPSRLNGTQKTAEVELPFSLRKSRGNFLVFPLSASQIVNFKNNLLAQQEQAQSIVRNKYHLQYLEEWFRYDKQGNWYLITLPVGKTWPFLIAAPQFFITTALPYRCAFWACTTRVWRNMRTIFCTNVG